MNDSPTSAIRHHAIRRRAYATVGDQLDRIAPYGIGYEPRPSTNEFGRLADFSIEVSACLALSDDEHRRDRKRASETHRKVAVRVCMRFA
jgi:hypothetical protein